MSKACEKCGKNISQNEVGLSIKLKGRNTEDFYCIECLAEYYRTDVKKLQEIIEFYQKQGCLFFEQS